VCLFGGGFILSDLASSCEHLGVDKTCAVFGAGSKVSANRQLHCQNDQKTGCCYLCSFRFQCVVCCKYLGGSGNAVELNSVPERSCAVVEDFKVGDLSLEKVSVAFCFSCNVEMAWAKTQFSLDCWRGNKHLLVDDKVLPVTVLLCPKCGKVEFKADNIVAQKDVEGV
jgi:hypothetical protein